MDRQGGQKPAGKARVFRLKAASQASSSVRKQENDAQQPRETNASSVAAGGDADSGDGDGTSSVVNDPAGQERLPRPKSPPTAPSPSDLLLAMERQLRAGITPTLPASAHDRAGLLASSVLPNGIGHSDNIGNNATLTGSTPSSSVPSLAPASASSLHNLSPDVSSFVVPIIPTLTKKRGRPPGGSSGTFSISTGRGRRGQGAATMDPALSFFVVKEWPFSSKRTRGVETIKRPPFFMELWMMMAAFGDPRGNVTCKCSGRGKKTCPCIDGVAAMETLVKALGTRLVDVCREWSSPRQIRVKHIRMAMPGEMREYMAWKEAHSKRGTRNEVERGADLCLSDLDDVDDDEDDDDDDDHDDNDVEHDGVGMRDGSDNDAPTAQLASEGGEVASSRNVRGGVVGGGAGVTGAASAADWVGGWSLKQGVAAGAGADTGMTVAGEEHGDSRPWQQLKKRQRRQKSKHHKDKQQQRQLQLDEDENGGEAREWATEEEEVASRMEHRKRFADERTAGMEEEDYVKTFFEFRKAFFLSGSNAAKLHGVEKKNRPGSRPFLARYIGLKPDSTEGRDKKLLEALAFMMYDFVGRVVEVALRKRTGGRLVCDTSDPMLSAEEINAAGATLPPLPGREQRENVRAFRAANPDGIALNRPLVRFPIGLEYRGDPLRWPRNTIEGGRVLVGGGEIVDTNDLSLAEEAMALLESDFGDF